MIKTLEKAVFRKFDLEDVIIWVLKLSHRFGEVFLHMHASFRKKILKSEIRPNFQGILVIIAKGEIIRF